MNILIDKSFTKDIKKTTSKKTLSAIATCIEDVKAAKNISELTNCKKLKGSKTAYRIRLGTYRIGFVYENKTVEFVRFLHRSKIYDAFP